MMDTIGIVGAAKYVFMKNINFTSINIDFKFVMWYYKGNKDFTTKKDGLFGVGAVAPTHSFWGIQKSYDGIRSWTWRSILIMEKIPKDTNTRFGSLPVTNWSSNTLQTDAGTDAKSKSSSQQQDFLSRTSTSFAPNVIGSTTSTTDHKMQGQFFI